MKKSLLFLAGFLITIVSMAQSDKYTNAMKAGITQIDSINIKRNGLEVANTFDRIAQAEKDKWLPYYYAAQAMVTQALLEQDPAKKESLADRASSYLSKAEELEKNNSEIYVLKSMIATALMTVDPQSRYMVYQPQIEEYMQKAKSLDPTNPRPYLFQAQSIFYTPEAFGGGKAAAKPLFDKALELFNKFTPATAISPSWGKMAAQYFLSQY